MDVLHPPLHFLASPPLLPPHSLTNLIIHTFHSFESKMEMFSGSEKTPPSPLQEEKGDTEKDVNMNTDFQQQNRHAEPGL